MKTCVDCSAHLGRGGRKRCLGCWRAHCHIGPYGLSPAEAQIYAAIVNADGQVMNYADLVRSLGYCPVGNASDSTLIRTHIHNLRRKLPRGEIGSWRGLGVLRDVCGRWRLRRQSAPHFPEGARWGTGRANCTTTFATLDARGRIGAWLRPPSRPGSAPSSLSTSQQATGLRAPSTRAMRRVERT